MIHAVFIKIGKLLYDKNNNACINVKPEGGWGAGQMWGI